MSIAFTKLPGLNQEKILAMVEPILETNQVDGVELIWQGTKDGQVLLLTIEKPGTRQTGEGITVDTCAAISRQVSEVLDESEAISAKYHLEVGSPGVERALYVFSDFERFQDQEVKIRLHEPSEEEGFIGQQTLRGTVLGIQDDEHILLDTDQGELILPYQSISSARLVFNWGQPKRSAKRSQRAAVSGKNHNETEQ